MCQSHGRPSFQTWFSVIAAPPASHGRSPTERLPASSASPPPSPHCHLPQSLASPSSQHTNTHPLKENPGLPSRGIFTPPRPTQSSHFPRPPCPPPGGSHFPGALTSPQALQLHRGPTPLDVRPPRCSSSPNHAHPQGLAPDLQSKKLPWVPARWLPIRPNPGPEPAALPTLSTRLPA